MVNIELSVFPLPLSFPDRQNCSVLPWMWSPPRAASPPRNSQGLEFTALKNKKEIHQAGSGWKMEQGMNSRREERVKLVIFLAHGCNYTRCIPEAFL